MSLLTPAARSHGQHSYVGLIKILRVFLNHLIRQFSAHHFIGPAGIDENQRQEDQGNDQHGEKRELRACAVPNRQRGDRVRRGRHQEREHRNERREDSSDFS